MVGRANSPHSQAVLEYTIALNQQGASLTGGPLLFALLQRSQGGLTIPVAHNGQLFAHNGIDSGPINTDT